MRIAFSVFLSSKLTSSNLRLFSQLGEYEVGLEERFQNLPPKYGQRILTDQLTNERRRAALQRADDVGPHQIQIFLPELFDLIFDFASVVLDNERALSTWWHLEQRIILMMIDELL